MTSENVWVCEECNEVATDVYFYRVVVIRAKMKTVQGMHCIDFDTTVEGSLVGDRHFKYYCNKHKV